MQPVVRQNSDIGQANEGPHSSPWKQQKLKPVCSPILTSSVIRNVLSVVGLIFVVLGVILLVYSNDVKEYSLRYDNDPNCRVTSDMNSTQLPVLCEQTFTLEQDMELPVYFYYELKKFYQNHRDYLQSYSHQQLVSQELTETGGASGAGSCDPLKKWLDPSDNIEKVIYPCGLVANSFFSDRFTMEVDGLSLCSACDDNVDAIQTAKSTGGVVDPDDWETWQNDGDGYWKKEGIAWKVDRKHRFNYLEDWESVYGTDTVSRQGYRQHQQGLYLPKISDEDYMVWARTAALPNFRKLHRKIEKLPGGDNKLSKDSQIKIQIANWFPVEDFDGEKRLVLTTLTWFGGSAMGLAVAYLVVGITSLLIAVGITFINPPRRLGDYTEFKWENIRDE